MDIKKELTKKLQLDFYTVYHNWFVATFPRNVATNLLYHTV
jgi:hypothetical protein